MRLADLQTCVPADGQIEFLTLWTHTIVLVSSLPSAVCLSALSLSLSVQTSVSPSASCLQTVCVLLDVRRDCEFPKGANAEDFVAFTPVSSTEPSSLLTAANHNATGGFHSGNIPTVNYRTRATIYFYLRCIILVKARSFQFSS